MADLEEMGLPTTQKDFSHIFTIRNEKKRKDKAKQLHNVYMGMYNDAQTAVEKRQDAADDERRELERISGRVDDCDTKGAHENLITIE